MYDINAAPGRLLKSNRSVLTAKNNGRLQRRKKSRKDALDNDSLEVPENNSVNHLSFPFLKGIKESDIRIINSRMVHQRYSKKEYIYLPYDNSEKVYFVIHGNVEIGYLDESGRELSIDILSQGEVFGSFMGRNFSSGFARSVDKTVLAVLNKDDFEEFLERYSLFSVRILKIMSQRINTLETKLQNLVFSDVKTRICKLLFSLYQKAGDKRNGQIKIPLTHQDIANLVASSRETASLHLSELKKSGTIAYERKRIRIISLPALEKITSCC